MLTYKLQLRTYHLYKNTLAQTNPDVNRDPNYKLESGNSSRIS